MNLSVLVNLGFSIPVIIRQGAYNGDANISNVRFIPATEDKQGIAKLELYLNRTGIHSTIGRVRAFWQKPNGEEIRIGQLNNTNVYTEREQRYVRIRLNAPEIRGGKIRLIYEGDGPDRNILFDEVFIPVGL
jgi:hypothetical protein